MKVKFKYKFKKYAIALMIVAVILALAVIVMNVFRFVKYGYDSSKLIGLIASIAVSVLILVLVIPMSVSSYYEISDKSFTLRWGILKNEIPIKDITKVIHNPDKDTLNVVFGEYENFMVISAAGVNVLDIVDALRKHNKKIVYECVSSDDDLQNKN